MTQKRALEVLDAVGGHVDDVTFRNQLFLYCQQPGLAGPYEFVPTDQGAFSFTAAAARRKLVEPRFVAEDDAHCKLTDRGRSAPTGAPLGELVTFLHR